MDSQDQSTVKKPASSTLDPRYLGFFECFNRQRYFEAHEVLEGLWLTDRSGPDGAFHKGLIQLAGAFVHIQKNRPGPAGALFKLARKHLAPYGPRHHRLAVDEVLNLISVWLANLETARPVSRLLDGARPSVRLD